MMNSKAQDLSSRQAATAILQAGGVGIMATDTMYGLVARAADKQAVARLYALKKRDHKPGTVIAASVQQLVVFGLPEAHLDKVSKWWPASLSVEIPLGDNLAYLHQNTGRQAYRVVADTELASILEVTGPLLTSSANQPGEPSATTIQAAKAYFGDQVDFYVDSGDLSGHAPSTIVRVTDDGIEVIRAGAVPIDSLN